MSTSLAISFAVLWALVIFHTMVLLGLTRTLHEQRGKSAEPQEAPGRLTGNPAPPFSATALGGETIDNTWFDGRSTALLFVSPDCETCAVTLSELQALQAKTDGSVVLFCRSTEGKCAQLADTYRVNVPLVVDDDLAYSRLFGVAGAPTAVLVGPDGRVERYGQPMTANELELVVTRHDAELAPS